MIIGIGLDLVKAARMGRWPETGLLMRYFDEAEARAVLGRGSGAALSLAGRFAAKEAFGKALGTGLVGIALRDIRVKDGPCGRPELCLAGTAKKALEKSGANGIHLSISHEGEYAAAMVVLEKD
ncbi:MAG: holo-ACP synthase [Treponema sp.]|nr:holo-ACP synthase [Treponema sp.]